MHPEGAEFLLIFDTGTFSEDSTFLLTDWLAHVPTEVIAKNFGLAGDLQAFDRIPEHELYIFPCSHSHFPVVLLSLTPFFLQRSRRRMILKRTW
jgi:hypothetical protein